MSGAERGLGSDKAQDLILLLFRYAVGSLAGWLALRTTWYMRNKADTIFHGYVLGWGYIHRDLMDEEKRLALCSPIHIPTPPYSRCMHGQVR